MIIILLGYMGSGKSVVGKILAGELSCRFTDLDAFIEQHEKKSIPALFREKGEVYFRRKETFYLTELIENEENIVISLGGGTPCYGANMERILKHTSHVFYLKASVDTLVQRLEEERQQRPLLETVKKAALPEFIRKHLFERSHFYLKAPYVIAVDGLQVEEIVSEIARKLA